MTTWVYFSIQLVPPIFEFFFFQTGSLMPFTTNKKKRQKSYEQGMENKIVFMTVVYM